MLSALKAILFLVILISFGFAFLNRALKIKELIYLIPFSILLGISTFIFLVHCLSYIIGPQAASIFTLLLLFITTILILIFHRKNNIKININKKQFMLLCTIALTISTLTFLAILRFGIYDTNMHYPLVLSLFKNNIYPPRDFYRPDYFLHYHFGADIVPGAINYICKLHITYCYLLMSTIYGFTIFFTLFSIANILTNNYRFSLLAGLATYFSGGLLWLDAILKYFLKKFPPYATDWSLYEFFTYFGLRGGITDATSTAPFNVALGLSYPLLVFCFFIFWNLITEKETKTLIWNLIVLIITLLVLLLCAEWIYIAFWGAVSIFTIYLVYKKQKRSLFLIFLIFIISLTLYKTIGSPLFSVQDKLQYLGIARVTEVQFKDKPFTNYSLRKFNVNLDESQVVSCFSWDFIAEFGLSIILFPIVIIYLLKTKNIFGCILFLSAASTMPLAAIFELKTVPIDINRLYGFGQSMLVLLITCGLLTYKTFAKSRVLIILYLFTLCFSPIYNLIDYSFSIKRLYGVPSLTKTFLSGIKNRDLSEFNDLILHLRDKAFGEHTLEINFLEKNSKPSDVAISSHFEAPVFAGVYTIIPPGRMLYKDVMFPKVDNIYETVFATLDPHLLKELNIKWIIIDESFKNKLSSDILSNLANSKLFKLIKINSRSSEDINKLEIYKVKKLDKVLNQLNRKTAWVLVNVNGEPIEMSLLGLNNISMFPSSRKALEYLNSIQKKHQALKRHLIMTRVVPIKVVEEQVRGSTIKLEKRFNT